MSWEIKKYALGKNAIIWWKYGSYYRTGKPKSSPYKFFFNNNLFLLFCNEMNKSEHHSDLILPLVSLFVSLWHVLRNAFFQLYIIPSFLKMVALYRHPQASICLHSPTCLSVSSTGQPSMKRSKNESEVCYRALWTLFYWVRVNKKTIVGKLKNS